MTISWTDAAIEAADRAYQRNIEIVDSFEFWRTVLDAAVELQGLETIGYRASERSFEKGRRIGRADALEEAAAILDEEAEGGLDPRMERIAAAIRALKEKQG